MSNVIPFVFENHSVRVVTGDDGEPLFVGKDVATALGYADHSKAIKTHCKAYRPAGVGVSPTLDPQTLVIPERDIYRLVMRSKLQSAEQFEEWVVGDVLPSIRKTGSYSIKQPEPSRLELIEMARAAEMERLAILPHALAHQAYEVGDGWYMISDVWRMAGIREDTLTEWVTSKADLNWGFRNREGGPIRPVQSAKAAGLVDFKRFPTVGSDGKVNKGSPVFCFSDRAVNIIMERVASDRLRQGNLTLVPRAA